jgi:hypothetical protein
VVVVVEFVEFVEFVESHSEVGVLSEVEEKYPEVEEALDVGDRDSLDVGGREFLVGAWGVVLETVVRGKELQVVVYGMAFCYGFCPGIHYY